MSTEAKTARHYGRDNLTETILGAVQAAAPDSHNLTIEDFAPVDEFHIGGMEATRDLAAQMELRPEMHLLDVGCGIGGPARFIASHHRCKITGVDLTEEFIGVAVDLTRILKLDNLASFERTSATSLPFVPGTFDGAYMIHVGMNISDKPAVFREVRRILKPGGIFAIFDLMRTADGQVKFPVPWAADEETSFVVSPKEYRNTLEAAGFEIAAERDRKAFAIEFTERAMARMAHSQGPVLGLNILMGDKTRIMVGNVLTMMQQDILSPIELIARAA